jgi:ABC-type multidrug transport system fused ATPase/permease subunit
MAGRRQYNYDDEIDKKVVVNQNTLKHLLGIYNFILPYRGYFVAGIICLVLSSATVLAFPYFTGQLIDTSLGKQLDVGYVFTNFIKIPRDSYQFLGKDINMIASLLILILIVQSIFSFLRVFFFARVSELGIADIRKTLYQKLITLPISFYDKRRTGELMSRLTADISLLHDTFSITLAEFLRQIFIFIIGLAICFWETPKLTFFMLSVIPLLIVAGLFFGKSIRKMSKKTQDELANANTIVEETLQAIHVVKAFTNEFFEVSRYRHSLDRVVRNALTTATYRGIFVSFIILSIFGGIVAVLWYGVTLVENKEISIGELTSFVIYTVFVGGSIGGLGDIYGQLQRAIGASERVQEILHTDSEVDIMLLQPPMRFVGNITFDNVRFTYPTRQDIEVLKGINLDIKAGEKVALVGHSGAGKSTIIQLLMRFYSVSHGQIQVDGKNIQEYPLITYRDNISIVPQEVILFGGTIKENIAYGKPEATEEEIIEAARKANALEFIESFPEKFATLVGERGVKLSGGQRQRIAIARAILKNPSILILDEATSSLDAESEQLVQEALEELMKDRTSIIIAHRLATIRKVDKIYVIESGLIVEEGSHEKLTNIDKGIYSNLIKLQMLEV